jgi:hypothetical protein
LRGWVVDGLSGRVGFGYPIKEVFEGAGWVGEVVMVVVVVVVGGEQVGWSRSVVFE